MYISKSNEYPICNFTIYGERHSGTKLLEKFISKVFQLSVSWEFGWKHFFGHYDDKIINYGQSTLFIGIVRNPYDWIMAMHKHAYHVPHYISSNLETMMFHEWLSINKFGKEKTDIYGNYEDRKYYTNTRYKNIFDLRYHKNIYLLDIMPKLANNYCLISYEDLTINSKEIANNIQHTYNLDPTNRNILINPYNSYSIDTKYEQLITSNIEWKIENRLGFYAKN